MFSAGLGQIDHSHLYKKDPELGMLIVKIGGPAYRIGMGGGAASSVPSGAREGAAAAALDFNAVQRGDAEVAQKLWRVVRACLEMGEANPIEQIHDQGAGGNCNVVKEIIYPLGARIDVRAIRLGDKTMSVLEIWGAEYQENDCLLIRPAARALLEGVCARERCGVQVIGAIDGCGRVILEDREAPPGSPTPVDLDLEKVLGDMPNKTFRFPAHREPTRALDLPAGLTAGAALDRVLRLPGVASKRFLTSKVDRSVTGLVAQQQCVGPLQLPLADVAVMAQAHTGRAGAATAIGEQPLKGLIDPAAMARMALGEALTNLVWARATSLRDVKASVNWMYAAKMGSEGAAMYASACALRDAMLELGVAVDGGKDSLSMAASAAGETVKCPGNLVVSAYVTCPDVAQVVTPDLKAPGASSLIHVDLGAGRRRLGGSALAQVYGQVGDACPDVAPAALGGAWEATQGLLAGGKLLAGHDVSDGGAAVALLEMAFAGNCGLRVDLPLPGSDPHGPLAALFAEELGLIVEVAAGDEAEALATYAAAGVPAAVVGATVAGGAVSISVGGVEEVAGDVAALRAVWEETAFALERLQCAEECVDAEQAGQAARTAPQWALPFTPAWTPEAKLAATGAKKKPAAQRSAPPLRVPACAACSAWRVHAQSRVRPQPCALRPPAARRPPPAARPSPPRRAARRFADKVRVAIIREEGSNGDREMAAAVWAAGMQPWDVTMSDLLAGRAELAGFQGVVFVGGFSYADVMDSAKGWAGTIRFNDRLWADFQAFYARPDTFSLGVCNGCQLMALLGWVPATGGAAAPRLPDAAQPRFVHNASGRFESRWVTVAVEEGTPAVMLRGMGGARLGVWCAHGEGRAIFPDAAVRDVVAAGGLAPIKYCDAGGAPTETYPANPNGSPGGIAALCSPDGRHLAMMPHPERCYMMWQQPWYPRDLGLGPTDPGPWLKLFQNAREWCEAKNN
jgi:phosphoribosylformylglycinamidine synthase